MLNQSVADALRVLVLAVALVLMGLSGRVVILHFRRVRHTTDQGERMLAHHVWSITASYILLVLFAVIETTTRIGHEPLTWRAPLIFVALLLGLYALTSMGAYQRLRVWMVVEDKRLEKEVAQLQGQLNERDDSRPD